MRNMKRVEDVYPRTSDETSKEIEDAMRDYLKKRIRRMLFDKTSGSK